MYLLKHTSPGEIPDKSTSENVLAYLIIALGSSITSMRGCYFSLNGLLKPLLSKIFYSGKWSRRRRSKKVRSASAVSRGTGQARSPWKPNPKGHLRSDQLDTVYLDPIYFLRTVEDAINEIRLQRLNKGAFI